MNVAGPSQPRFGRTAANGRVPNISEYEDDLLRLLGDLGPLGAQHLRQYYENRTRAGERMTDHDLAMSFFLQNAVDMAAVDEDLELARRLAEELNLEEDNITMLHNWRNVRRAPPLVQTRNTRAMAANRATGNDPYVVDVHDMESWFATMFGGWFAAPQTADDATAPAAPWTASESSAVTPPAARPTGHVCVICQGPIYGSEVRAPCSHYYDITCLTNLFESATRDESLYPPRCCKANIPLAQVRPHLSHELISRFEEKGREFGTLKRVYCVQPTCSRFLGPVSQGTLFSSPPAYNCPAPGCTTRTCAGCRGKYDGRAHTCQQDQGTEHVLNLGQSQGWSRCPGCEQLIELNMGCFHMTCRCRTEFCYVCRARWKTCACPQWEERRLIAVVEQRVDAQLDVAQRRQERRRPRRLAQQPIAPVVQPRAHPILPVPARPAARPRTPTPPPVVQLRLPVPVQNRSQPIAGPARPAPVPTHRQREETTPTPRARLPVAASTPTPTVRTQPQAQRQVATPTINPHIWFRIPGGVSAEPVVQPPQPPTATPAINPHIWFRVPGGVSVEPTVRPPQSPTATPAIDPHVWFRTPGGISTEPAVTTNGGSRAQPPPPAIPPKPIELTGSTRISITPAQAGPSTASMTEVDSQASSHTLGTIGTVRSIVANLDEPQHQDQQGKTQGGSGSRRRVGAQTDMIRQGMIHQIMQRLGVDQECNHTTWQYHRGGGQCENCHRDLPLYLFRCPTCEILVCNGCRRNRL